MRDSRVRSRRVVLAIFLAKMRLGLSNGVVASMFHLKGKGQVSGVIHAMHLALSKTVVPRYLGFQHNDR